nr:aldehyde dehydrogenase family protein [Acidimicrobiia bacterium]
MSQNDAETAAYISELMGRARKAQKIAEGFSQEKVDELAHAVAWEIAANDDLLAEIADFSFNECRLGDIPSKIAKVAGKCRGILYDVKNAKSVGVVEEIPEKGLVRIAKPVGVVGSLVPSTQGEFHPLTQAIFVVKARDAVIFSPHPRSKLTTLKVTNLLRAVMKKYDAPEDLFICIEDPSIPKTNELMKQCDLVIATGGQPMVRAAHSSGTPAFGVGAGNAIIIIDETADLADAAAKIKASKTFDLAAGCSCDNAVVIHESVYADMLEEFRKVGAHLVNADEKDKLRQTIWPEWPANHILNRHIVA